jgi:ubiquinone/menaquinone biosynthesis C-methylase UbiE
MAGAPDGLRLGRLDERKKAELEFHDMARNRAMRNAAGRASCDRVFSNEKFYAGASASRQYVETWVKKHSQNRIVLDCACGDGKMTRMAAQAGANLAIGIDISGQSIENARSDCRKANVMGDIYFVQADAEDTRLPAGSIDIIVCSGVLHHLDLSYAFPEFRRILTPGGRVIAYEALAYNPLIKLYRYLTPGMRTEWEKRHILSLADVRFAGRFFRIGEVRYWHMTSILTPYARPLLPVFNAVDGVLTRIPLVRLMAWMFTFERVKPGERR